jgi:molybdate transport system ATP-binding protein
MSATDTLLRIDLSFRRAEFELQAHADLDAGVTGIYGPSGAGKSTLLELIMGLLRPTRGSLHFRDQALADVERAHFVPPWQRHFGLVFQEGRLFPHLSVRRNLVYGAQRLRTEQRRLALPAVVELLELQSLLQRWPSQLSGGERQRVALGRALLFSPRLLLLDEPLSSLDQRLRQQILPFLKRIKDEIRIPMIYVSHEQREIDYIADRILRIGDGQLLEA